jgi:hypothetical protein
MRILRGLCRVPLHDRSVTGDWHDLVDTELGQLLHNKFGPAPLDDGKPNTQRRRRALASDDLADSLERVPAVDTRTPSPSAISCGDRVAVSNPHDSSEVVRIVGGEKQGLKIINKNVRPASAIRRHGHEPTSFMNRCWS